MPLTVGSRLDHYDVTALIGEGGMGQVYQATDIKLNRGRTLVIMFVLASACAAICLEIGPDALRALE